MSYINNVRIEDKILFMEQDFVSIEIGRESRDRDSLSSN